MASKARAVKHFHDFVTNVYGPVQNWEIFCQDRKQLQDALIEYFKSLRTANGGLPTINSFNCTKSHIKMYIKNLVHLDISSSGFFPQLAEFLKKYSRKISSKVKLEEENNANFEPDLATKLDLAKSNEKEKQKVEGVLKNTLQAKKSIVRDFEKFLAKQYPEENPTLLSLVCDIKKLEPMLIDYFQNMRSSGNALPKIMTFEARKSHLKMEIKKLTNNGLDISDNSTFPNFNHFVTQYKQTLKLLGYASVDHHAPMPQDAIAVIEKLLR